MRCRLYIMACFLLTLLSSCGNISVETRDNFEVVELPEGSTVYMNKNSSLSYPENFIGDRTVELEGEAYFNVVSNDGTFTIKTSQGNILITGTKLNVEADSDALIVEVDEGSVEVSTKEIKKILKRGQRAVKRASHDMKIEKAHGEFRGWIKQLEKDLNKAGEKAEQKLDKAEKKLKKLIK